MENLIIENTGDQMVLKLNKKGFDKEMISNSVVIDTNLVFSALIPKASQIRDILFESNMNFYSPNILIAEIYKHKDKLND